MMQTEFFSRLESRLQQTLPGIPAQLQLAPMERLVDVNRWKIPEDARKSAVLILLYENEQDELCFPLQQRNAYPGVHSRQVSLPGGSREDYDADYEATALRETEEEIGLPASDVRVLGRLTEVYIPPSNYLVQPIVGCVAYRPVFQPDPSEVEAVLEARVSGIIAAEAVVRRPISTGKGKIWEVPCFLVEERVVWGATAMMLSEFRAVLADLAAE